MTREDPKKVAERVRRYRANTPTERLEIVGVTPELKEQFRALPGLEDLKAADRLQVLMEYWIESHPQAKPVVIKAAPAAPVAEDLNLKRRQEIDKWFKNSGSFILPQETARSRFWQRLLKEDSEVLTAVQTLSQHVHPDFSKYLKKNLVTIVPSQLKTIAALELNRMIELAHVAICRGGGDPIAAVDVRLQELKRASR